MSTVSSSFKGNLYTLQQVISIKNDGFKYNIPENVQHYINYFVLKFYKYQYFIMQLNEYLKSANTI